MYRPGCIILSTTRGTVVEYMYAHQPNPGKETYSTTEKCLAMDLIRNDKI